MNGPMILCGVEFYFSPISTKHRSRLHQFGTKMPPSIFIEYALDSGGGWTRDLIIADWHDIENKKEVSWNQGTAGNIRLSLRRWFAKTRKSRTKSNSTPPGSREIRRGTSTIFAKIITGLTWCRFIVFELT